MSVSIKFWRFLGQGRGVVLVAEITPLRAVDHGSVPPATDSVSWFEFPGYAKREHGC